MNISDLKEITELAEEYRRLSAAMRQAEICYSQPWVCSANGHSIPVVANEIDAVFTSMRDKVERRLTVLGVKDFEP